MQSVNKSNGFKLSVMTLAIMNVTAVVSLRGLATEAIYGLQSAFYYLFAAIVFLIPTAMVAAELAAMLGSDTPFFVYDDAQYCTGRGEIMEPTEVDLHGLWLAVVKPNEGVSTAEAYSGVKPCVPSDDLRELLREGVDSWQGSVTNDFEDHILAAHPQIAELKAALLANGAVYASMSGSGSAVFGLFKLSPELRFSDDVFVHVEYIE